ncbi:penicillin acylase family protein [Variovorax sp. Root473]|uniref:penicillin acylase family protein n=1 Tax=Variovorax sp. Root473 TaxID=1736541 RepID=UPI001F2E132C|nr:penicillin acylase family protein [Variovorax sp. Root473]
MPSEFDPARGYVVTANENNILPDHPVAKKSVGHECSDAACAPPQGAVRGQGGSRLALHDRGLAAHAERHRRHAGAAPLPRCKEGAAPARRGAPGHAGRHAVVIRRCDACRS